MPLLNERIKSCRNACGLTLLEVAEKIGVTEATMQRYESGDIKNIKHETIVKLADIFKVDPSYLMGWDVSAEKQTIAFSDFDYALQDITRELTDEDKQELLKNAQRLSEAAKWRKRNEGE